MSEERISHCTDKGVKGFQTFDSFMFETVSPKPKWFSPLMDVFAILYVKHVTYKISAILIFVKFCAWKFFVYACDMINILLYPY